MKNLINGHKPQFGNPEQIEWLKQQARLKESAERGFVEAEVDHNPLKDLDLENQLIAVRFRCPYCLSRHQFSFPLEDGTTDYTASCGGNFRYEGEAEKLRITS